MYTPQAAPGEVHRDGPEHGHESAARASKSEAGSMSADTCQQVN